MVSAAHAAMVIRVRWVAHVARHTTGSLTPLDALEQGNRGGVRPHTVPFIIVASDNSLLDSFVPFTPLERQVLSDPKEYWTGICQQDIDPELYA